MNRIKCRSLATDNSLKLPAEFAAQGFALLLRASLRFGVGGGGLGGDGLVDLEIGHLQFAEEIQEQIVFLGSKIALGFFMQGIQHVDEFVGGFGVDDGLAGARVGVSAKNHGGVAAQHANEIFERLRALGSVDGRLESGGFLLGSFSDGMLEFFALGFAFFFLGGFFAKFAVGGKGAAVDDAKGVFFFVLVIGQGDNPSGILGYSSLARDGDLRTTRDVVA